MTHRDLASGQCEGAVDGTGAELMFGPEGDTGIVGDDAVHALVGYLYGHLVLRLECSCNIPSDDMNIQVMEV